MELFRMIIIIAIIILLYRIFNYKEDLIEGLCSAPDGQDQTGAHPDQSTCEAVGSCSDGSSGSESDCTTAGETWTPYTWTEDTSNLPYQIWQLPGKDGNMVELRNIRPWREFSNAEVIERGADLPISAALSLDTPFANNYPDEKKGTMVSNDSIVTLLEEHQLDPAPQDLTGESLQNHYASKCYEKVQDYNQRGQPNNELGDPKPVAFRIFSYTPNNIFTTPYNPSITVNPSSKVSMCEILGTKEIDPRFPGNKNNWTKKYPVLSPYDADRSNIDQNMVNKYPDNIESGCYAFVQTDDGTTKQVLVPSSIDTRAENHDLAPTIFYDHCLALNGPCGPGGGTTIDGKWIPGDSCAGYQKSSTWTESWPHDGLLERSGEDGSDGMRRAQRIITPQGKDAYDETQIRGKRNDIKKIRFISHTWVSNERIERNDQK